MQKSTKRIAMENEEETFMIRAMKDEGVALLTTRNNESYLLLDSINDWYDLIQDFYPWQERCSCKNEWFNVQAHYMHLNNPDKIKEIRIQTTCTECGEKSELMSMDIRYTPTGKLISDPLTPCEKPHVKQKYTQYTSYWSVSNLEQLLNFVHSELQLYIYAWYFEDGIRHFGELTLQDAIQRQGKFLHFYFSTTPLFLADISDGYDHKGIYIQRKLWRKREIIDISIVNMGEYLGPLYNTEFSTHYVDKSGEIINKSKRFADATSKLSDWFKANFINKRSEDAFDSPEGYERYTNWAH
ncbi:MAG: hypothetical protein LUH15_14915 [Tannerellaceae bacterium]|nr:hypothetical protein [Tannerellaceae bacterium]